MAKDMLKQIQNIDADVFFFDIDGTLKNLCEEHTSALKDSLNKHVKFRIIRKIILIINSLAMGFVKTGILPTNTASQRILLFVYSALGFVSYKKFRDTYCKSYKEKVCLFYENYEPLKRLLKEKQVFFVTINRQNYNLECLGVPKEKIFCSNVGVKYKTYKKLFVSLNCKKDRVVIIGDNLFDDMLSAKLLGTKKLLVNNYDSKLKKIIARVLKIST